MLSVTVAHVSRIRSDEEGRHLARNILAGGGSSIFKVLVQLAMLPIMGRILGPREFGLYATALPVISFFSVIADGGLGVSLAREPADRTVVWSTAFYLMLAVGVCLAGLVNLCGLALALMMHEPRLGTLMAILSISFVFITVAVLPAARLVRANDLVTGASADVVATVCGTVLALGTALSGYGALSLAFQFVGGYAVRALVLNLKAFEAPTAEFSLRSLAGHVDTGGVLVAGRLLDLLCRLCENLLFSSIFGIAGLGAYTFANQVSRFLSEAASNPIWSALYAQALREDRRSLAMLLMKMSRLMAFATFPAACLVCAAAPQLLGPILGPKWAAASPLLQVLIPSYAIAGIASLGGAVLLATGGNRAFLATFAVLSIGRVLVVAQGVWIGALGVASAIAIVHVVYAGVMRIAVADRLDMTDADPFTKLFPPLVAGAVGGVVCYMTLAFVPVGMVATLVALMLGAVAFLLAAYVIEGARIATDLKMIRRTLPRRKPAVR